MGDVYSVTNVHLVQLENRQLKIEKCEVFFKFVSIADFLRTFDQFSILYDFN